MGPIADHTKSNDTKFSILVDKSILITGGVSGIGALVAERFINLGAHVTVADITQQQGKAFVEEIERTGHQINFVTTDVSRWDSQVQAFKSAIK